MAPPTEEVVCIMISVLACNVNLYLMDTRWHSIAAARSAYHNMPGAAWLLACWRLITFTMHASAGADVQHEAVGRAWRQQAALGGGPARCADALLCLVSRSTLLSHALCKCRRSRRVFGWLNAQVSSRQRRSTS
jgi:hypothetical protein